LFDTTGQAWASQVSVYNPAGQVTRTEVAADDGSATVNIYDPAHIHPDYDHAVGHFDSQHRETSETDTYGNNSGHADFAWDPTGQSGSLEQATAYNSAKWVIQQDIVNIDGTIAMSVFDPAHIHAVADWSMTGNALGGFGIPNGAIGKEWTVSAVGEYDCETINALIAVNTAVAEVKCHVR
jgi:hypothetical protein